MKRYNIIDQNYTNEITDKTAKILIGKNLIYWCDECNAYHIPNEELKPKRVEAIIARIDGQFDNEVLVEFGYLSADLNKDIDLIAYY